MKYIYRLCLGLLLALLVSSHGHAQATGSITIESPWARATPGGAKTGAAYMTVVNKGNSPDRLIGAATPVADNVQFHKDSEEKGVARMRQLPSVDIAPGATVSFKPGDMHMMLVGLKQPLKEGQTIPLTLTFENAGKLDVTAAVAKVGAMQHGDMGRMMHGHDQ
jgi:copper(I)-binding protein